MLFIPLIIGFLLLVSTLQTLLYPKKEQNKAPHTPPPYNYGSENPYFQHSVPYGYPQPNVFQKKALSEEEILEHKKREASQSVFYTLLFVLGLIAFLLYN